jgi:hypothetical protein
MKGGSAITLASSRKRPRGTGWWGELRRWLGERVRLSNNFTIVSMEPTSCNYISLYIIVFRWRVYSLLMTGKVPD